MIARYRKASNAKRRVNSALVVYETRGCSVDSQLREGKKRSGAKEKSESFASTIGFHSNGRLSRVEEKVAFESLVRVTR